MSRTIPSICKECGHKYHFRLSLDVKCPKCGATENQYETLDFQEVVDQRDQRIAELEQQVKELSEEIDKKETLIKGQAQYNLAAYQMSDKRLDEIMKLEHAIKWTLQQQPSMATRVSEICEVLKKALPTPPQEDEQ